MPVVPRRAAGRRVADDQGQGNSDDEAREVVSVEAPGAAPTRQQPSPEAGPSQQIADLSSLMEAFAKSQAEANRQLIETLLSTSIAHARSSTPATAEGFASTSLGGANSHGGGNFSKCTARFDGEKKDVEVLEAFIDAVQVYKDCAGVSDEHALRGLPILLVGDAAVWWQGIKRSVRDWDDAINHLRAMYGSIKPAYKVFREMFAEEHTAPQRSEVFACKLRALMSTLPYELCEEAKVDIVYGLLDRKIRKRLPRELLNSLDDTICKLRHVEESMAEVKVPKTPVSKPKHFTKSDATDTTTSSNPTQQTPTSSNTSIGLGKNRKTGNTSNKGLFCYGCGQQGVIRSKCNKCTQVDKKVPTKSSSSFNSIELKPFIVSHYNSSLPTRDRDCESRYYYYHDDEQTFTEQYSANSVECLHFDKPDYSGESPYSGKQPYSVENLYSVNKSNIGFDRSIDRVYFENFECFNDMSCVNYSTLEGQQYSEDNANIQSANIDPDPTWPLISIGIGGREGTAFIDTGASHCLASPSLHRVLLDAGTVFIENQRVISLADGTSTARTILTGKCNVTLQSRDVLTTFLVIPGADTRTLLGRDFITDAGVVLNLPQWSWSFADDPENNYDFVRSYSCVLSTDADALCVEASQLHLKENEGMNLSVSQRAQLNNLIASKATRFAADGEPTTFATHHVKVGEKQEPIASPPYRMSPAKRLILEKELDKLLSTDVIEECESPWAANVVLVTKKDGGTRLCIDYRKLNAVTEPDRYPLPRMDDVLHAAKTSNFMSTLDLRSGYFQVCVSNEDRDKTAFVTPLGTFRFKRMPMGLRNSGATFQRLMDRFKSNLQGVSLLCYLDDLIVLSDSFDKHLSDLEAVFDRLELFNLRINREKSVFARDSVKFLGHLIVPGGIQVDPGKTAAINDMAVPKNLTHLKCFLQTSSWFRRFIPNYAEIARPLTSLLKKDSAWHWSDDQQAAFDGIKQLLVSAPILRQADETLPFTLRTDSSGYCLGAVLMQGEGPEERPIEYASRLLNQAERNYSTTEREALAVVWAVNKFRGYIEGAEIVVKSDHQPLKWLMNVKSPSGRLTRWALTLQSYNLRIEYTPGKSNVIADTLSRPACTNEPDCDLCQAFVDVPARDARGYRDIQLRDPDVRKILEDLEASDEPFRGRPWADRGYVISDGVLYRYGPEQSENDDACLVVPSSERHKVLADYHDAPTAGHLGTERTLQRIASRYYWPGMRAFVAKYIKECVPCQRYKVDTRKPAGLIQSPAVAQRFEVIAVDLFGPLPETELGNKWILIIEDVCSRWVELFPLKSATSFDCAEVMVNEVFLRYGVPRRMISDNGVQFISEIMQQVCYVFGVDQALTPYYHPEANPVERKNRDLKPQLAIHVGKDHSTWDSHLAAVRFAMNSAVTHSTGYSPAMLTFGRELRAPADVVNDMRAIVDGDRFVANVTPYLKRLATILLDARDVHEKAQDIQKKYADEHRRPAPDYGIGDWVLLKTQGLNDAGRGQTPKFIPRRDGPYRIRDVLSSTTYSLERVNGEILGKYHASQLTPFIGKVQPPLQEKRKRGRPRKH